MVCICLTALSCIGEYFISIQYLISFFSTKCLFPCSSLFCIAWIQQVLLRKTFLPHILQKGYTFSKFIVLQCSFSFPIRIIMLCLRLKLLQITNLHIRIKLGNSNPIKTIHIALVVTLKIPFHNSCIP